MMHPIAVCRDVENLQFSILTVGVIALSLEPCALSLPAASRQICILTGRVIRMELLASRKTDSPAALSICCFRQSFVRGF